VNLKDGKYKFPKRLQTKFNQYSTLLLKKVDIMTNKIKLKILYNETNITEISKPEKYINFVKHLVNVVKEQEETCQNKLITRYNK